MFSRVETHTKFSVYPRLQIHNTLLKNVAKSVHLSQQYPWHHCQIWVRSQQWCKRNNLTSANINNLCPVESNSRILTKCVCHILSLIILEIDGEVGQETDELLVFHDSLAECYVLGGARNLSKVEVILAEDVCQLLKIIDISITRI